MSPSQVLTAMKSTLSYSPETGLFSWLAPTGRGRKSSTVGSLNWKGYRLISVASKQYRAHRLAWLYVHGCWPTNEIDHINQDKDDNRMANLRDVTREQNHQNRGMNSNNLAYAKGVCWHKQNQGWTAQIMKSGKQHYLGCYPTIAQASAAYKAAADELFTHHTS